MKATLDHPENVDKPKSEDDLKNEEGLKKGDVLLSSYHLFEHLRSSIITKNEWFK